MQGARLSTYLFVSETQEKREWGEREKGGEGERDRDRAQEQT